MGGHSSRTEIPHAPYYAASVLPVDTRHVIADPPPSLPMNLSTGSFRYPAMGEPGPILPGYKTTHGDDEWPVQTVVSGSLFPMSEMAASVLRVEAPYVSAHPPPPLVTPRSKPKPEAGVEISQAVTAGEGNNLTTEPTNGLPTPVKSTPASDRATEAAVTRKKKSMWRRVTRWARWKGSKSERNGPPEYNNNIKLQPES